MREGGTTFGAGQSLAWTILNTTSALLHNESACIAGPWARLRGYDSTLPQQSKCRTQLGIRDYMGTPDNHSYTTLGNAPRLFIAEREKSTGKTG
jgi:hypothetical protein